MTDKQYGFAQLKPEGGALEYDGGKEVDPSTIKDSETRWIEMCYDPNEPVNGSDLDNLDACIRGMTDDEKYILIKALANMHIKDGPF